MKLPIAAFALVGTLAASAVGLQAQYQVPPSGNPQPRIPVSGGTSGMAPSGSRVIAPGGTVPELTPPDQLKAPTVPLPDEPVEPYLLTKDEGPFMVLARVFRGVDAERMALALVKELRDDYKLPAYILRTKDYPGKSMIRGIPPTVPSDVMEPNVKMPEKIRTYDEAAVLVGNEKTMADQEKLWRAGQEDQAQVPRGNALAISLAEGTEHGTPHDQSLCASSAPLPEDQRPAGHPDEFGAPQHRQLSRPVQPSGRRVLGTVDVPVQPSPTSDSGASESEGRAHCRRPTTTPKKWRTSWPRRPRSGSMGQPVYVFHDRTSSRVFVGSFKAPQDPGSPQVRDELVSGDEARGQVPAPEWTWQGRARHHDRAGPRIDQRRRVQREDQELKPPGTAAGNVIPVAELARVPREPPKSGDFGDS